MALKCSLGIHSWNGCKCSDCGKTRDELHTWNGCQCSKCGKTRDEQHNWDTDCDKCSRCGKTRFAHNWSQDCEKCCKCGKTRIAHDWSINCEKCGKCGKTRSNNHQIVDGICKICNHGVLIDPRDGNTYNTIRIGDQVVMKDNLVFKPKNGNYWAPSDREHLISSYGYLYDWETAKTVSEGIKGWHLPTKEEWLVLFNSFEGYEKQIYDARKNHRLFQFDFAGGRSYKGEFYGMNEASELWSCTPDRDNGAVTFHCYNKNKVLEIGLGYGETVCGLSVRLFRDN